MARSPRPPREDLARERQNRLEASFYYSNLIMWLVVLGSASEVCVVEGSSLARAEEVLGVWPFGSVCQDRSSTKIERISDGVNDFKA